MNTTFLESQSHFLETQNAFKVDESGEGTFATTVWSGHNWNPQWLQHRTRTLGGVKQGRCYRFIPKRQQWCWSLENQQGHLELLGTEVRQQELQSSEWAE